MMRMIGTIRALKTSRALAQREQAHTPMRVFLLTIFFNNSIQLSNCDEVGVAMFHDKWKGE
jgi:hypothetical protein